MNKYRVAKIDEIPVGGKKIVKVKEIEYGIYNIGGQLYAWRNVCPHAGAPVCAGVVCGTRMPSLVYEYIYGRDQEILRCPWHGWEFDLKTGEHLVDPETKLRRGKVEVGGADKAAGTEAAGTGLHNENLEKGILEADQDDVYLLL
ncbi:Rieske (2Fe-2S) protein [Paenibacillus thalictri]|uniref:Rieske (2Fe-2S) protein n=1 Tax=Paenibacillus thalictri TaxID=2527873 RepID=A0A4Q9DJP2_9BACL|nr:Rieske (2Fe-2S) protein [Paenibacillus thalictri]